MNVKQLSRAPKDDDKVKRLDGDNNESAPCAELVQQSIDQTVPGALQILNRTVGLFDECIEYPTRLY